jgi:hypothetical protein
MTAIGYAVLNNDSNPSSIGLLLMYALSLNYDILNTIFSFADMETTMISVERAMNFMDI